MVSRGILVFLLALCCCYGDDHISHLILLDDVPASLVANSTPHIEIRTNFSGGIEFRESDQFKVLLNISAPSIQEAYAVAADVTEKKGRLLVQVYEKPVAATKYSLRWIFLTVGCIGSVVLALTIFYVIWWYSRGYYRTLYGERAFLEARNMSRSRNSVHLAQGGDPLLDQDHGDDDFDAPEDYYNARRKADKTMYVSPKPETIMEESEESADDDRTNPKLRFTQKIPVRYNKRHISVSEQRAYHVSNDNIHGSGFLVEYPDQSGDELENDLSPDQIIAGANGNYTALDELDDLTHDPGLQISQSTVKLADPRGNLDYNIHTSKSDGDLLDDQKKMSEKEKVIIPPSIGLQKPKKKTPVKSIPIPKRAEPNIYQRGLNLRQPQPQENDLNALPAVPDKVRAQVHSPEHQYANNSFGQYLEFKSPEISKSRISRESNDAYELYTYPADLPMSSFKTANASPMKESVYQVPTRNPRPVFKSSSPTNFDFNKLDPKIPKIRAGDSNEPYSPGKFSMLSEGSDSSDLNDDDGHDGSYQAINRLEDSDIDDLPSPDNRDEEGLMSMDSPLPSPPPLANESPYDTNHISQLSPRLSLVTPLDGKDFGTMIALTGSPSPGGPYSKHSVNTTRFEWPPPPSMFQPEQPTSWSRRELDYGQDASGEYVGLPMNLQSTPKHNIPPGRREDVAKGRDRKHSFGKRDRKLSEGDKEKMKEPKVSMAERDRHQSGGERERKHSFGKKGGKLPKHLNLTIMTTFCVLGLISGVYCVTSTGETTVNIVVYVPKSYPYKNSTTIVSAINSELKVPDSREFKHWFVSNNPILDNLNSSKCVGKPCAHACDDNTGTCICKHGYQLKNGHCIDINECQTGMMRCLNHRSGCLNLEGSYECLCSEKNDLYRSGDQCLDCSQPCPDGGYETQPCNRYRLMTKICKDCTKSCGENFFRKEECSETKDAVCNMCTSPCNGTYEFEYQQCHPLQNRQCKDKSLLPKPSMGLNVILDDLDMDREQHTNTGSRNSMVQNFTYNFADWTILLLKKGVGTFGSEIWVELTLKNSKPVAVFNAVDHSDDFSQEDFQGHEDIIKNYCPYPVPYQYELKFIKHNDTFYKGSTNEGLEACESHVDSFPSMSKARKNSIFCTKPGLLSDVFHAINPEDYKTSNTVWEEMSDNCRNMHEKCENCSRNCSETLQKTSQKECAITADDDSGLSPRLPACFKCCMDDTCRNLCEDYHKSQCRMVRCQKGNLVQFQLKPVYKSSNTFYCHIEPARGQRVVTVEYGVHIDGMQTQPFLSRKLDFITDDTWANTGGMRTSDDIIYLELDSMVNIQPDFVKLTKDLNSRVSVDVGKYSVHGDLLKNSVVSEHKADVRPSTPFGLSKKQFVKESCEDTTLDNVHLVTWPRDPYTVMTELLPMSQGNGTFLVSNKTVSKGQVGINRGTSLLRALLKPTKVMFDTLAAKMTLNGTHWIIVMTGEVETCPGVFSLNLSDTGYLDKPIYSFDVGIQCPRKFGINFTIPTADRASLSKDMQLQVRDETGTFILVIHTVGLDDSRSGSDRTSITSRFPGKETSVQLDKEPAHFSILFIAIVMGIIVLLLLLLMFGAAWKQGIPEGDIQRFRIRLLVLLVIYITFQFIYSILVSMTVFVMIIRAINVDTTTFVRQYNQQRSVTSALSQLELDSMETHLWAELERQNIEATQIKHDCYATIQTVIQDVERLRESIETKSVSTIQKQNLKKLITEHSQSTLTKFSTDLQDFQNKYKNYAQYVLHKLTTEINNTYNSIRTAKMLQGARYVYSLVRIKRELYGRSGMTDLMTWLNMQTDMMKLAQNTTLLLPGKLPVLKGDDSGFTDPATPPRIPRSSPLATHTVNKWFVQSDVVLPGQAAPTTAAVKGHTKKVSSLDLSSYTIFLVFMVIIDLLWLTHRMVKACGIGKLLLYGYPVYVDARDKKDEKKTNKKSFAKTLRNIANRVVSTMIIPKLIGTLFVCLMVYFVTLCAHKFINRETFGLLGYHNDMEDIMRINEDIINTRITSHADRVNKLEYKMYEDAMNVNIQNHQYVLNLIETQWGAIEEYHTDMYCNYLGRINVTASCHGDSREATLTEVKPDRCSFAPIIPVLYKRNATESARVAGAQLDGFLFNIRKLISDSCYVIIIYLSGIVIKELFGTVLWIYVKRSGFVSLRIIYETDEAPGSTDSSTTNKP